MRAQFCHIADLVEVAAALPGAFAEIGVWRGDTLEHLCRRAYLENKQCYAVDSFEGMAAPGPLDVDATGRCEYPQGALAVGPHAERLIAARCGLASRALHIIKGFVPDVLASFDPAVRFAFVHVDLDHYQPTLDALLFCWPRMVPGGILCCHDWMPRRPILASAAFDRFVADLALAPVGPSPSTHGWVVKQ